MISTTSFSIWVTFGRLAGDHLWQSTLFAVVAGLLTLAFRNNRAEVRNRLWLAASVKFLIPFAALTAVGSHLSWRRGAPLAQDSAPFVVDMDTISQPFSRFAGGAPPAVVPHSMVSAVPVLLFVIWLCGCAAILLTWWTRWRRGDAAVRDASPVQQGPEFDALRRLEAILGITKPVALVSSSTSLEPAVFGIVTPVLLWPRSIAERLTEAHAEMILAHELSHVRHRDNLAAAVHMVVETIFWFHPLVWWLGTRMVDERERACDEDVLRLGRDPQVYAESVLKVCEFYLESPLACMSGVTGSNLKKRMERIMSNHVGEALNRWRKLFLATAGVAALAVPIVVGVLTAPRLRAQAPIGQSPSAPANRPEFDAASVKQNTFGPVIFVGPQPGGRFTGTNVTLDRLVRVAYELEPHQLIGGQDWTGSEFFDIEAKTVGDHIPREQIDLMLQSLLADRFKLAVHHETRQMPVYTLVLSKAGRIRPQLVPHSDDAKCADTSNGLPPPPRSGEALLAPCGGFHGGPGHVAAQKITMEMLARYFSNFVDRIVVDKTGLSGTFDADFTFTAAQSPLGVQGPDVSAPNSTALRSIFTAVQDQLGLKLVPQTSRVDVLVIDHVEQPSPN